MKLFENKVGRPSNEVIMKRRTFTLVVTALSMALVGSFAVAFSDIKSGNLSGSAVKKATTVLAKKVNVSFVNTHINGTKLNVSAKITNNDSKSYYYRTFYYINGKLTSKPAIVDTCKILPKKKNLAISKSINTSGSVLAKVKVYKTKASCNVDKSAKLTSGVVANTMKTYVKTTTKNTNDSSMQSFSDRSNEVKEPGTYTITFNTSKLGTESFIPNIYYRVFTYSEAGASGNMSLLANCESAQAIGSTINVNLQVTDNIPNRSVKFKEYKSLSACQADIEGISHATEVLSSSVKDLKLVK